MLKFEYPEITIDIFAAEDIITTSGDEEEGVLPGLGENDLPWM